MPRERKRSPPSRPDAAGSAKTAAVFFPFDLFGSAGARAGAELVADAFHEMLADNRREKMPTRARAYQDRVHTREVPFATLADYQDWRERGRRAVRQVLRQDEFLLWVTGNHLGVLPLYDELAANGPRTAAETLVVQFDAHLDVYNLSECTSELSHGNFLLHCASPLPRIINVGTRELLLRPDHVRTYYQSTFSAHAVALDSGAVVRHLRRATQKAKRIFIDIDCDVFAPAHFPAVTHPTPFGLSPEVLLRFLDAIWSDRVAGVAISEFDPGRDRNDQSLATLVWLLEYLLLRRYE